MKVISTLLMATAISTMAAASDPGETAVKFLEKVRSGTLNLEPGGDTALTAQTSDRKRQEIARRFERMSRDLGADPLEVGPVKLDDDLAAVLIHQLNGFDPSRLQVFPLALVKRGDGWAVAPVPASFENAGVGYTLQIRKRFEMLEEWMLHEQAVELEKLRDQSADRMRRKIEESLPRATLRNFNAAQTCQRFLDACEQRNLPEIFGLLGGLAATPPGDWQLRQKAANTAVAATGESKSRWHLLTSPDVLRATVLQEEIDQSATISIACLDPAGNSQRGPTPQIEFVHLELSKTPDGYWRIDPPQSFLEERYPSTEDEPNDLDADLLDAFTAKLSDLYPPTPLSSAVLASQSLLSTLHHKSLSSLVRLIRPAGEPSITRKTLIEAARLWWSLHESSSVRNLVPLAFQENGDSAAGAYQFFSASHPDRFDLKILYFEKSAQGWLWTPEPLAKSGKSFVEWSDLQAREWRTEWRQAMLKDCHKLEKVPDSGAPSEEDSRKLVNAWLGAVRSGDLVEALGMTTRLETQDSAETLLRNLGYDLAGSRRYQKPQSIGEIHRGDILTSVSAAGGSNGKIPVPIYPIITTPAGPRILLEIDLLAAGNRTREFLNKTALERLRKSSPAAADDLRKLYAAHQPLSTESPKP